MFPPLPSAQAQEKRQQRNKLSAAGEAKLAKTQVSFVQWAGVLHIYLFGAAYKTK
jgi:hypothetical protein